MQDVPPRVTKAPLVDDWGSSPDWNDDDSRSVSSAGTSVRGEEEEEDCAGLSEEERKRRDELRARGFSLKRLVRLLHINSPVFHVMALLGKK